jgi:hypothetical protein
MPRRKKKEELILATNDSLMKLIVPYQVCRAVGGSGGVSVVSALLVSQAGSQCAWRVSTLPGVERENNSDSVRTSRNVNSLDSLGKLEKTIARMVHEYSYPYRFWQ